MQHNIPDMATLNHLHACSYFTRPFTWRKPKQEAPDPEIILKSSFHHEPKLPDAPPPENKKWNDTQNETVFVRGSCVYALKGNREKDLQQKHSCVKSLLIFNELIQTHRYFSSIWRQN